MDIDNLLSLRQNQAFGKGNGNETDATGKELLNTLKMNICAKGLHSIAKALVQMYGSPDSLNLDPLTVIATLIEAEC